MRHSIVSIWRFNCVIGLSLLWTAILLPSQPTAAGLVSISTSTATGIENRDSATNFVGILIGNSPPQLASGAVNFINVPAGEGFLTGDLVGRDMDEAGGGRTWEYLLTLPADAVAGTGFTNIDFIGHAFERSTDNLDGLDAVLWELYLNGILVGTSGPAVGSDWTTFDPSLTNTGGSTINQVRVVFTVTGFNDGNDWFATRGALSANYVQIAEPIGFLAAFCTLAVTLVAHRNRRRFAKRMWSRSYHRRWKF